MWGRASTVTKSRRPVYRYRWHSSQPKSGDLLRYPPPSPHVYIRGGHWPRDQVAAQTCTDACTRHPPLRGRSPPRQGKLRRSPHLTGKQQLPKRRTPAPSAASASPSAAHHFLRGSVGRPGRAPRTLRAEGGPRHPAAAPGFPPLPGVRMGRGGHYGGAPWGKERRRRTAPPRFRAARKPRRRARPGQLLRSPTPRQAPRPRRVRPRAERKRGKRSR